MGHRIVSLTILSLWLVSGLFGFFTPVSQAQTPDWFFMSPDLDGDGLPNSVETTGWCNAAGCFSSDPLDPDGDDDGLTDGEEKLFDSQPGNDASPGIYVIYEDQLKTKEYYPWQQYGSKLIARGDSFVPPDPDLLDVQNGHATDLDAVVVRRGATFLVGGRAGSSLQVSKSKSTLTDLTVGQDPYTGKWRVSVPANGTVGKYTLSLGGKTLDLLVIFELPNPTGELTSAGVTKFLYDDNPSQDADEVSILLGDGQYPPGTGAPYPIPTGQFIAEGTPYKFKNQQYNRYLLEEYVMPAINGLSNQRSAADALVQKVDALTVFRNPRVFFDSWRVLHPGTDLRQQCSNLAGLVSAFNRAAGIPARPFMTDWRNSTFDHANELWLDNGWRVYRGYRTFEMKPAPNNTHTGCDASVWPACGARLYFSRFNWGKNQYKPWHSGGDGGSSLIVLADDDWTSTGLAYRWPSWAINTIKLVTTRLKTQHANYWGYWGWTQEPQVTGTPGWPDPPSGGRSGLSQPATALYLPLVLKGETDVSQPPLAQFGSVVAEYGVDSNGNGQYDQLILEVEVTVAQPGSYWLRGVLSASRPEPALLATGGVIAEALVDRQLAAGRQIVPLIFSGEEISRKRVEGPYQLSELWLTDVADPGPTEFINHSLAYRGNVYTTQPYPAPAFDTYGALLSGQYSHAVLDSDGDGPADTLVVTTGLNVYQPATYTVKGHLYDGRGEFVGQASWSGAGPEVVLRFEQVAGTIGPYRLGDLDLYNAAGQSIDYQAEPYLIGPLPALSQPARAALGLKPGADDLIAVGTGITPTYVFNESLVNGNLRLEAGVNVAQAGFYKLEAWLADAQGNLLTWTVGQPTALAPGQQTLALTFDGSAIRSRGVAGPYTVVALKILAGDTNYTVLDRVNVALTTRPYTRNQLAPVSANIILEDFVENGGSSWQAGNPWIRNQAAYFSPIHAWYGTNAAASLTLAEPLDLTGLTQPALKFQTSHKLGTAGDTGYVEVSTDGLDWTTLATFVGNTIWSTHVVDLSPYVGHNSVQLRFRLASAAGIPDDGWYIDDVLIGAKLPETPPVAAFTTSSPDFLGTTTTFDNSSTGNNLTFEWNFGDGSPLETTPQPSHTYATTGTFTVHLTATNSLGSDTAAVDVVIAEPPPVLRGHWTLDETTGQRQDGSTFANHLTAHNGVGSVIGRVSLAADLESTSKAYLSINDSAQNGLDVTGSLTLVGWMNPETLNQTQMLVAKYEYGPNNRAYRLDLRPGHKLGLTVSPDGGFTNAYLLEAATPISLSTNTWYHVAGVFDAGQRTLSLYLDGNLIATRSVNYSAIFDTPAPFMLGANLNNGSVVEHFDGQLDDWRVYATVLSESELEALLATPPSPISGLTASNDGPTALGHPTTLSASLTGGNQVSYTWDFGDGSPLLDGGLVVSHIYPAPGSFSAMVTAVNSVSSQSAPTTVIIQDVPAVAAFTSSSPDILGQTTSFTNQSSGANLTYAWDFGDGSPLDSALHPSHTYATTGTFTVVLTATNELGSDTATSTVTIEEPPPAAEILHLSLANSGSYTVGPVTGVRDEDILRFDGTTFAMFFDGSDVGVGGVDVDALGVLDADTLLLSFDNPLTLGSLGTVDDFDIVQFDATSLGNVTAGSFTWYFDGSDVGLSGSSEDIDALVLLPDGRLLISTGGDLTVSNVSAKDEDLVAFTPATLGQNTSGTWAMYFDGSDVGLNTNSSEDVSGAEVTAAGQIYLTTLGDFAVTGVSGTKEDIFVCLPTSLGNNTACTFASTLLFDGSAWGLTDNNIDAFSLATAE